MRLRRFGRRWPGFPAHAKFFALFRCHNWCGFIENPFTPSPFLHKSLVICYLELVNTPSLLQKRGSPLGWESLSPIKPKKRQSLSRMPLVVGLANLGDCFALTLGADFANAIFEAANYVARVVSFILIFGLWYFGHDRRIHNVC